MSTPNSTVEIMFVPFNHTQQNVFSFTSIAQRDTYFKGKVVKTFLNHMVVKDTTIRLQERFENVRGNYVRYNNNNKWYYGFIDEIVYINENVTEIRFTIDAWVTYYFDIEVKKCFVEREHVIDDSIGKNTVAESVTLPKEEVSLKYASEEYNRYYLLVTITGDGMDGSLTDDEKDDVRAGIIPRVVGRFREHATGGKGLLYSIDVAGIQGLKNDINNLVDKGANSVVSMVEVPSSFVDGGYKPGRAGVEITDLSPIRYLTDAQSLNEIQSSLGYTVRNKKLLSDQFFHWEINNGAGGSLIIYPSDVNYQTPKLVASYILGPKVQGILQVSNLRVGSDVTNLESAPIDNVSWFGDTYAEYLANNRYTRDNTTDGILSDMTMGIFNSIHSQTSGGGIPSGDAIFSSVVNNMYSAYRTTKSILAQENDMKNRTTGLRGGQTSSALSVTHGNRFSVIAHAPNKNNLKRLDDFLTRYGYQVNEMKVPNMTTHSNYNYVKTSECNIIGRVPSRHLDQIISMFNNGFTIWHSQQTETRFYTNNNKDGYEGFMNYDKNEVREGE